MTSFSPELGSNPASWPPMTLNGTTTNPDQFSQVFILPPQLLPGQLLPGQLLPAQLLPGQLLPAQLLPAQLLPGQLLPGQLLPAQMLPGQLLPAQLLPGQLLPAQLLPGQLLPAQLLPGQLLPAQLLQVLLMLQLGSQLSSLSTALPGSQGTLQGKSIFVFLFWELRSLSQNFHIHVSVSDLYICLHLSRILRLL